MKKLLYLPFLIMALSTSCKKEEHNPVKTLHENQLLLKRNGELQTFKVSTSWLNPSETILIINTESPSLKNGQYRLFLQKDIPPGFYEFSTSNQPLTQFNYFEENKYYEAYDGTLHILSNDPVARRIEFQFQIKLYNPYYPSNHYKITEGYAVANY